jgi:hypothetical protein
MFCTEQQEPCVTWILGSGLVFGKFIVKKKVLQIHDSTTVQIEPVYKIEQLSSHIDTEYNIILGSRFPDDCREKYDMLCKIGLLTDAYPSEMHEITMMSDILNIIGDYISSF